jgi:hypothetical protein
MKPPWPASSREIHFRQGSDVVPGCTQEGNENGSDVATIARNEDPHRYP